MRRLLACLALLLLTARFAAAAAAPAEGLAPGSSEFFTARIHPLLEQRCLECHGDTRHKGGLRLNEREAMLKGGDTGPAIVPGDAVHSLLLKRVRDDRGTDDVMPPKEPALTDAQIADLAAWIAAGAPGSSPESPAADTAPPSNAGSRRPPLIGRLHPLVVHFPICCLLLALLAEFLYITRGPAWQPAVSLLVAIGAAGAAVAVLTGTWFATDGTMFQRPERTLGLHELMGWLTLVLSLTAGALLVASRNSAKARVLFRLALLATAVVSGLAGHLGGTMVYGPHWLL